jgi:hypothetical protein
MPDGITGISGWIMISDKINDLNIEARHDSDAVLL